MFGIGAGEFIVILIVALIVFGPSKLPEIGKALGKGLREFRKAQAALSATLNESDDKPNTNDKPNTQNPTPKTSQSTTQTVTADDVINLAKDNPIVKESNNEKISNGNPNNTSADNAGTSSTGTGRSSNGTDK